MAPSLHRWDRRAARTATRYLANSSVVAERVKRTYGIEADVVHPPPGLSPGPGAPGGRHRAWLPAVGGA
ncbi:MAG: hypothetical protein H0X18_19155 [Geodermatophilaceae bacterium]|nr:hypothetical protein [Geodermatophilaceae bacterium]